MYIVDQYTLTSFARASRRNLLAQGCVIGHQAALNICIDALGIDSSNKAAAILRTRPIMIAAGEGEQNRTTWHPSCLVAQLGRLVVHQRSLHGPVTPSRVSAVFSPMSSDLGLGWRECRDLIGAALVAGRISSYGAGRFHALRASSSKGLLSLDSAFVLESADAPHPAADALGITPTILVERAVARLAKLPRAVQPTNPVYMGVEMCFEHAAQETLHALPQGLGWLPDAVVRLCGTGWQDSSPWMENLMAVLGPQPLEALGLSVLKGCAERGLLAYARADGSITLLHPENLSSDDNDAKLVYPIPGTHRAR